MDEIITGTGTNVYRALIEIDKKYYDVLVDLNKGQVFNYPYFAGYSENGVKYVSTGLKSKSYAIKKFKENYLEAI